MSARLSPAGGGSTPWVIRQRSSSDCGVACLAMLLRVHRGDDRYDTLPQRTATPAAGLSVRALIQLAAQCDLRLRAVRFDPECPDRLPHASIVHTVTAHYLLFDQLLAGGVRVLDPASGVRFLSLATFTRLSSGVALLAVTEGPASGDPATRGEPGAGKAPPTQLGARAPGATP